MKQGIATNTVDEYISQFPLKVKELLQKLRETIREAAPDAEENISYKMPAYKLNGPLVYFAAYKNHIGLYATPACHQHFKKQLSIYKAGKGSVQFPLDKPLPFDLITKMVKFKARENVSKAKNKPRANIK